jgi:hypothetical protein
MASFGRRLKCALFHQGHEDWSPIRSSWLFRCRKCGVEGIADFD